MSAPSPARNAPATDPSRGSTATTSGVRINVSPRHMPAHSITEPGPGTDPRFVFSYRIRIENAGNVPLQLRSRHWVIVDADGHRHEVEGEGVVGQQPRLDPGEEFEYESFCPLPTPWGTMEGVFRMEVQGGPDRGRLIEARIARFYLVAPVV